MTVMKIPQHFSLDVVDAIRRIVVAASNFLRSSSSFRCWIFYVGRLQTEICKSGLGTRDRNKMKKIHNSPS